MRPVDLGGPAEQLLLLPVGAQTGLARWMTSAYGVGVLKLRDVAVLATYDRLVTGEPKAGLPRCTARRGPASIILAI